jgi:uncharacterized membrane protein YfcA
MAGYLIASITLLVLAFVQNTSFSIVSRSRNRNDLKFHLIAAFFSNSIWFLTFRHLVRGDMSFILFPWYCVGTMLGSMFGVRISMWIEKRLGASADAHLKKPKVDLEKLEQRVRDLELGAPRYDD